MERELVLQELDEPKGTELFEMEFRNQIGINFTKWKQKAKRERNAETKTTTYTLEGIQVEISEDHQFYVVYELKINLEGNPPLTC
jgi:hypothetical protein